MRLLSSPIIIIGLNLCSNNNIPMYTHKNASCTRIIMFTCNLSETHYSIFGPRLEYTSYSLSVIKALISSFRVDSQGRNYYIPCVSGDCIS